MRRLKERERLILLFLLIFITTLGVKQKLNRSNPNPELKEIARETTAMWQQELQLSEEQRKQVEAIIIAFSNRKNQVLNSKIQEDAKAKKLKPLQLQEQKEMEKILSNQQYDKYLIITQHRIRSLHQKTMA